jgi:4-amino-4-deoxy-L-arabinose transferase-like glycosyltransferase
MNLPNNKRWIDPVIGAILIIACAALSLFFWNRDSFIGTDGYRYAVVGANFISGQGYTYAQIPHLVFHPLYPILIGLVSLLVSNLETAAYVASLLPHLALVPVLFWLTGFFFDRRLWRWAAVALVTLHPDILRMSASIYTETLFTLLLVLMLGCALKAADREAPRANLFTGLFGLCGGLAYLTRPEGLMYFAAIGGWLLIVRRDKITMIRLVAAVLVACLIGGPWVMYLSSHFDRPALTGKKEINLLARSFPENHESKVPIAALTNKEGTRTYYEYPADIQMTAKVANLSGRYGKGIARIGNDLQNMVGNVALIALALGLYALWRRRDRLLLLAFLITPALSFPLFIYPVERRFLVPLIVALSLALAAGWAWLAERLAKVERIKKWNAATTVLVIAAIAVHGFWYVDLGKRFARPVKDHQQVKAAAAKIEKALPEIAGSRILARRGWVPFYVHAEHRLMPWYLEPEELVAYAGRNGVRYLYFERRRDLDTFPQYRAITKNPGGFGLQTVFENNDHFILLLNH